MNEIEALDLRALASLDGPIPISPGIVRYSDAKGHWWDLDAEDDPVEILGPVLRKALGVQGRKGGIVSLNGLEDWRPRLGDGPERYEKLLREAHSESLWPIAAVGVGLGVFGLGLVVLNLIFG